MSALKILGKLLSLVTGAAGVVDKVERVVQRISRRPAPPLEGTHLDTCRDALCNGCYETTEPDAPQQAALDIPSASPIYKDEHCFSREAPSEPPPYCYYCRQLKSRASRFCPGVPR